MSEAALHVGSGKVRELYALDDDRLLLVASDRISTFDVVLPTEIPDKGRVLTASPASGSRARSDICPNHLLALRADGRSTECRRLEMLPIECVVRGYLAGLRLEGLQARPAQVCGIQLPAGLIESEQLPEPIFTPATKATTGHDENIDREQAAELVGDERLDEVERAVDRASTASRPSTRASAGSSSPTRSSSSGSTTAGRLVLADEVLTPDSSRFWPADEYAAGRRVSRRSTSSSCATTASRSAGTRPRPGPSFPDDVVAGTRRRYVEAFERLTGIPFDGVPRRPEVVLE